MSAARVSTVVEDVGWWAFVVGLLMSPTILSDGMPRRYADYVPVDHGWSGYVPLGGSASDAAAYVDVLMMCWTAGFAVTVIAAVAGAIFSRRLWSGILAVAAPVAGGLIVWWTLVLGVDQAGAGPTIPVVAAFFLVLVGIGVRALGRRVAIHRALPTRM